MYSLGSASSQARFLPVILFLRRKEELGTSYYFRIAKIFSSNPNNPQTSYREDVYVLFKNLLQSCVPLERG